MKLNYKQTFLIGFGFFASSVAWSMYNVHVPTLLEKYLESTFLIGIIMTFDNIFGVIFQPLFGTLSDKTRTRFGRRMPYILIGLPICAVAFSLIPFTWSLATLMGVVIIFNFVMSTWRAPVVALMPDITPPPLRSKANGIINFMGGLGSLFSFAVGGILFKLGGVPLPFIASSVVMLLALLVLKLFVHEEKYKEAAGFEDNAEADQKAVDDGEKSKKTASLIFLLFAILFWFCGYNAVETFFSLYVINTLKDAAGNYLTEGDASLLLAFFSVTFLFFSIPAGFIGSKIGRKKTIMTGLAGVTVLFIVMVFTGNIWVLRVLLFLGGAFWACVNINSLPMVVELAKWKDIGKYTGYYYFFSFSAAIISPILFGWIRDLVQNYDVLFIYAPIAFALAFISMIFVRHGEAKKTAAN
ncbi:MAG TPA: SLC45 family MFS transporter [Clostridiaceae bacterium]|nr:SLC45 family MFS transporter [Clostridiaceae bacterium]